MVLRRGRREGPRDGAPPPGLPARLPNAEGRTGGPGQDQRSAPHSHLRAARQDHRERVHEQVARGAPGQGRRPATVDGYRRCLDYVLPTSAPRDSTRSRFTTSTRCTGASWSRGSARSLTAGSAPVASATSTRSYTRPFRTRKEGTLVATSPRSLAAVGEVSQGSRDGVVDAGGAAPVLGPDRRSPTGRCSAWPP